MQKRLDGRIALVTGGSRGLGAAIARQLGRDGAVVAVHYRTDADAAAQVVADIAAEGGHAIAVSGSIGDLDAVDAFVDEVVDTIGAVDLLVSNAGTASRGQSIADSPNAEFEQLLRIHALGPLHLVRRLLPGMRALPRGDVIAISSATVADAPPFAAPYTVAKSALETAMRTLAREERRHGIRVNIVAPGLIDTDMGQRLVQAKAGADIASIGSDFPFGHVCRPEEVSGIVAFLASAEGGYITGQRITVDGGGRDPEIF
ncbi:SDR family oxidoreductase [Nocardia sp. NBC_00565]|uniref:SDR family NAD(P)-dependent oxidoreductase n=1 Tax=Nocardia sp. NBC_00565 TaxID=2975993 RepID=UPI002E80B4C3|nr:SDR family oxidoreductase [Nocardia sp. NBC_00565]WUC05571.1 SDR family oxidoreductase [Nocardia sp. NBC_00565]